MCDRWPVCITLSHSKYKKDRAIVGHRRSVCQFVSQEAAINWQWIFFGLGPAVESCTVLELILLVCQVFWGSDKAALETYISTLGGLCPHL